MTAQVYDLAAAREESTARLEASGWQGKEPLGKRIWRHPESGFYYSEEMALEIERRGGNGKERECISK